jgi:DNA-binding XRE family transcriptional regulator
MLCGVARVRLDGIVDPSIHHFAEPALRLRLRKARSHPGSSPVALRASLIHTALLLGRANAARQFAVLAESTTAFGVLLRQHRRAARLTREEFAERAGLSVSSVEKLERQTMLRCRDSAERLVSALALAPDEAIG